MLVEVVRGRMRDNRRARDLIGLSGEWRLLVERIEY